MSGTWWTRLAIIVGVLLWATYTLLPTFVGQTAAERNAAMAADVNSTGNAAEPEVEEAWYEPYMTEARINLGIDLRGGIDLTLDVDINEAVISSVQRDIKPVKDAASEAGLNVSSLRRERGEPVLLFGLGEGTGMNAVTLFMSEKYPAYAYDGTRDIDEATVHAWRVTEEHVAYVEERSVKQALETLRNRIDETGVKEPSIVLKGGSRINVQLPGMDNPQQAIDVIGTTAVLEFFMVDEDSMKSRATLERALLVARDEMTPEDFVNDDVLSEWMLVNGHLPDGDRLMWEYWDDPELGKKVRTENDYVVVRDEIVLTGDDINDAYVAFDSQTNQPRVSLQFKPRGARVFDQITAENVGRRFAIVLDKQVRSAPYIRERISGGTASIEMGTMDIQTAQIDASSLALVLRTGALPAPVTIGDVRTVGASLGDDAIAAGERATFVGFGLVLTFMVVYYRKAGMVSVVALCCNIFLVMALLATAGATLTLPGIAGIALTVGMAVDANIIIYERIREERRLGKNDRAAADAGFGKALWAVLDANITTFIAGVVLYTYGTGPIKGFAVTLMIGIITTLFTGIFVSRTLMDFLTRKANTRWLI
jgi:preprotein translocase subunit SecD